MRAAAGGVGRALVDIGAGAAVAGKAGATGAGGLVAADRAAGVRVAYGDRTGVDVTERRAGVSVTKAITEAHPRGAGRAATRLALFEERFRAPTRHQES